jgi:hypothetical protein
MPLIAEVTCDFFTVFLIFRVSVDIHQPLGSMKRRLLNELDDAPTGVGHCYMLHKYPVSSGYGCQLPFIVVSTMRLFG